jgi:hypothetical protein
VAPPERAINNIFDASNAYVQSGDELGVQVKKNKGGYTSGGAGFTRLKCCSCRRW